MKTLASLTVIIIAIIIGAIIVSSAALTVEDETADSFSEEDMQQMIDEIYTEISTYMQVDKIMGKFDDNKNERDIRQIAILLHPKFSTEILIEDIVLEISNGFQTQFYYFNGIYGDLSNQTLFTHSLWTNLPSNSFAVLPMLDKDQSIKQLQVINKNSDRLYIVVKIPDSFSLHKGDELHISLYPPTGVVKKMNVRIPFSISSITTLS